MFHRHHEAGGGHAGQPNRSREQQWEKITGNVVDKRLLQARYPPHPKIFGVQLHPEGREPFRAEVHVSPNDRNWEDLYQPQIGDVRRFVYNPATGETRFDMTDGRNSWAVQNAETDALMAQMLADQPAPMGEAVTGPPWVVPATCPTCGAAVDQAQAAMDLAPQCAFCHQPLPAQPRARFLLVRQDLSMGVQTSSSIPSGSRKNSDQVSPRRFVFIDERARRVFPDWDQVADERAFHLSLGAPSQRSEQLIADLTALAGPEFTDRVRSGRLPRSGTQAWCHPVAGGLLFDRELLDFPPADAQQLVVLLPANDPTSAALSKLLSGGRLALVK